MNRGDIVIVDLRPHDPGAKVRPALIVQCDRDNARMSKTIVAMITGNTRRAGEPSQLLIDQHHADWRTSGLNRESVVNCSNLFTVDQHSVIRTIGRLSAQTLTDVDACLKDALGIA